MGPRKTLSLCIGLLCVTALIVATARKRTTSSGSTASDTTGIIPEEIDTPKPPLPETAAKFVDVTDHSGIVFTYRNGEEAGHFSILESLGGGAALFDYDTDGDLDLFLPGGGKFGPNRDILGLVPGLFRNEGDFRFTDVTHDAGFFDAAFYSHGAAAADYDQDGYPDLLVTGYGGLLLYHNQGDGTFAEVAGVAGVVGDLWSSSAAWGDIDNDGDLDLYVANYVDWSFENDPYCPGTVPGQRDICPPKTYEPLPDYYFSNNGDGTFRDDSQAVGLQDIGKGLGVLIGDFDNDGDADVYVANDTVPNFLYRNDGSGYLEDYSMLSATALSDKGVAEGSMGVDLADFNLDGQLDLWVANYERESIGLYRNEGNCSFQYVSQSTGITAVDSLYVGWGTVFFDFDRDGDEDVVVSNGHVVRFPENAPLRQRPLLFENQGGTRFENVAPAAGDYLTRQHMGRGLAMGDIDEDGDVDLVISHTNEPVALLSNESGNDNNWMSLRLIGTTSNRAAIGARIAIRSGGSRQWRQVKGGTSYASTHDPRVFVGFAQATVVDEVEIHWPSGLTQTLTGLPVNRVVTIIEGQGVEDSAATQ